MHKQKSKGMAGTIIVVLVMGLLVSISTAYLKMVQTESQIQNIVDHSDRALDAAFSGVNYAMAVAQSNKEMFINDATVAKTRNYFVRTGYLSTDWSGINLSLTSSPGNFENLIPVDWFLLDDNLQLFSYGETGDSTVPYRFRAISYPGTDGGGTILPDLYLIKAQGVFRIYDETMTNIDREYKAQIIAECEVNFNRRILKLKRWRYMPFETDANFVKAVRY